MANQILNLFGVNNNSSNNNSNGSQHFDSNEQSTITTAAAAAAAAAATGQFSDSPTSSSSSPSSSPSSSTSSTSSSTTTTTFESIDRSAEYLSFRARVALKKVVLDDDNSKIWSYHECGPRAIRCPVIMLPPVSGTADIFFRQLLYLSDRGHRVIAVEYPAYFTFDEFFDGFQRLLRYFRVKMVHLFGASLGGFLAQKFAQYNPSVIASLFLCNTFGDTARFKFVNTVPLAWFAPAPLLRSYFVSSEVPANADDSIRAAAQFMSAKLATLSQTELLSRLNLNLTNDYVAPDRLQSLTITIMDVFDHCANSTSTRQELYKLYPRARRAHLKSGSNFPYLSRADEVNMHMLVHLRQFNNTPAASCIHFVDLHDSSVISSHDDEDDDGGEGGDDHDHHGLESSIEVAKIAEEFQRKQNRNKAKLKMRQEQQQQQKQQEPELSNNNFDTISTSNQSTIDHLI